MEKRGITQELPDKMDEIPDYIKDFQDDISERVIKQIKEAKEKNGSTTTQPVSSIGH